MKLVKEKNKLIVTSAGFTMSFVILFVLLLCVASIFVFDQEKLRFTFSAFSAFLLIPLFLTIRRRRVEFDSKQKKAICKSGVTSLSETRVIPFDRIKGVKLEKWSMDGNEFGRLVLVLDNEQFPLSETAHKINPELKKQGDQILRFVGIKESTTQELLKFDSKKGAAIVQPAGNFDLDNVDPRILDLIRKKRLIEAVKMVRTQSGYGLKESKDVVDFLKSRMKETKR